MNAQLKRNAVAETTDFTFVASVSRLKSFLGRTCRWDEVAVGPIIHALALRSDFFMLARPSWLGLGFDGQDDVSR